jgi:hypothetical protein
MLAELFRHDAVRCIVDLDFKRAALFFRDKSFIEFEHSSRQNRWARPSADGTLAEKVCKSIRQFRLNAKHLQLFFEDGSDLEFFAK